MPGTGRGRRLSEQRVSNSEQCVGFQRLPSTAIGAGQSGRASGGCRKVTKGTALYPAYVPARPPFMPVTCGDALRQVPLLSPMSGKSRRRVRYYELLRCSSWRRPVRSGSRTRSWSGPASYVSRHPGLTASSVAARLVDEGLRMEEHPGVIFRNGPMGRRATLVGGPDVWEVIRALRSAREAGTDDDRSGAPGAMWPTTAGWLHG